MPCVSYNDIFEVASDGTYEVELLHENVAADIPVSVLGAMRKKVLAASEADSIALCEVSREVPGSIGPFSKLSLVPGAKIPEAMGCHIDNVHSFYLQLSNYQGLLSEITAICMAEYGGKQGKRLPLPSFPGSICVARFREDGVWYRAEVLAAAPGRGNSYRVRFVDYGNSDICAPKDLCVIEGKLLVDSPAMAIHCSLNGGENALNSPEGIEQFRVRSVEDFLANVTFYTILFLFAEYAGKRNFGKDRFSGRIWEIHSGRFPQWEERR